MCRALADTGVAGRPDEYFLSVDPVEMPGWATWEDGPWGLLLGARDRAHYLELVYELGTTPNGVFGAKLMWNNLHWALQKLQELPPFAGLERAAVIHALLPDLRVIHLTRRDHLAQAVSWARASQDGIWVTEVGAEVAATGPTHYDPDLITGLLGLIAESEAGWRALFDELGVTACEVVYEELTSAGGWEPTVRSVLDHLSVERHVPVPPMRTRRQADELNAEWIARYAARPAAD